MPSASDALFLQRPATDWIASNRLAFAILDCFPVSPRHVLIVSKTLGRDLVRCDA
jgi:diadenosine tetraphosphate (Ap4A) HIT family hydrolase